MMPIFFSSAEIHQQRGVFKRCIHDWYQKKIKNFKRYEMRSIKPLKKTSFSRNPAMKWE